MTQILQTKFSSQNLLYNMIVDIIDTTLLDPQNVIL